MGSNHFRKFPGRGEIESSLECTGLEILSGYGGLPLGMIHFIWGEGEDVSPERGSGFASFSGVS